MSAASVADTVSSYFGGEYDPATRTYRTPQLSVPGVTMGVVRRAKPKRWDNADYFLGAVGAPIGCAIVVDIRPTDETRTGFGGSESGLKRVQHEVTLNCMLRCEARYAEQAEDALNDLHEAIVQRIRADRTCGSGGIEAGGFQVGEDHPGLRLIDSGVVSTAEKTEALLSIRMDAVEYVIA